MKFHHLLLFTVMATVSPLPSLGAYVRGDLVWKCDFTPEEAVAYNVEGLRFSSNGYGAAYLAHQINRLVVEGGGKGPSRAF